MIMINFFLKDFIALLGLIVLAGGAILFVFVSINLLRSNDSQEDINPQESEPRQQVNEQEEQLQRKPLYQKSEPVPPADSGDLAILETFLKSVSDDLAEIKQKLNEVASNVNKESMQISKSRDVLDSFNEQLQLKLKSIEIDDLKKEMKEINIKLSALYKVLSKLSEIESEE